MKYSEFKIYKSNDISHYSNKIILKTDNKKLLNLNSKLKLFSTETINESETDSSIILTDDISYDKSSYKVYNKEINTFNFIYENKQLINEYCSNINCAKKLKFPIYGITKVDNKIKYKKFNIRRKLYETDYVYDMYISSKLLNESDVLLILDGKVINKKSKFDNIKTIYEKLSNKYKSNLFAVGISDYKGINVLDIKSPYEYINENNLIKIYISLYEKHINTIPIWVKNNLKI